MTFFDDLGKKISGAGHSAVHKTEDFVSVTKLKSNISDEEKKIKKLYLKIGKEAYEAHIHSTTVSFDEYFDAISASLECIKQYNEQITQIRNTDVCPNCGERYEKGASSCTSCGAILKPNEEPQLDSKPVCPYCSAALKPGSLFCTTCGKKL